MPRQAPGHRMNTKANFDTPRPQLFGNFCYRILRLSHRHTVARVMITECEFSASPPSLRH